MQFDFEWDPIKAKSNLQKHKVSFERAAEIFSDPFMLSVYDNEHSETEERWITVGKDNNNVAIVAVHTFEQISDESSKIRIISARRATKKENEQYNTR